MFLKVPPVPFYSEIICFGQMQTFLLDYAMRNRQCLTWFVVGTFSH